MEYNQFSVIDPVGRVFSFNNKIYRGIYKDFEIHVIHLFESGLIDELMQEKLFPYSNISLNKFEGFDLVIEHEKLFQSYPHEWTPEMLKDAALATIKVNAIASKYGYEIKDAHGYNVLFQYSKPYFIDLGSFERKELGVFIPVEFLRAFILPLLLYREGDIFLAQKLLKDPYFPGARLLNERMSGFLAKKIQKFQKISFNSGNIKIGVRTYNRVLFWFFLRLFAILQKLKLGKYKLHVTSSIERFITTKIKYKAANTIWSNYQKEYFNGSEFVPTSRINSIIKFTNDLEGVSSIVDVAGNNGMLANLLLKRTNVKETYLVDYDLNALNLAYQIAKSQELKINIIAASFLDLITLPVLRERIRADAVYALALTHHLVLTQGIQLNTIFETLNDLTNKFVFVEFMPLGLWSSETRLAPTLPPWYNIEWFKSTFDKYFRLILFEKIEENRILFIGEKKYLESND